MHSSPVRRFTNVLLRLLARLACIRRAASVRSEPGSNSQIGITSEFGPRATTSIHLTPCSTSSIQLSKNDRTLHASRALYSAQSLMSRDPLEINSGSFPQAPHRDSPSGAVIRQEQNNHRTGGNITKVNQKSQVSFPCIL